MDLESIGRTHYDAIVVGARAAGAATAMLLARSGARVLLLDRGEYGSDTLSTHALMRGGVLQLTRWGLLPAVEAAGTPAAKTTTFHYDAEAIRIAIKPRDGVSALYAPRRTVLDRILADAAHQAGAEVVHEARVIEVTGAGDDGRVSGVTAVDRANHLKGIGAAIVIGADGMRSTVAKAVNANVYHTGRHASGIAYAYFPGLMLDGYHWYFSPGGMAGAVPTNDDAACVFAAVAASRFHEVFRPPIDASFHRLLVQLAPELAARMDESTRPKSFHTFSGQTGFFRQSWGPGWALVGDAGYFKDPATAHGITDALRDAELLARAIIAGGARALWQYQGERDELSRGLFDVTDAIAAFDWDLDRVKALHLTLSDEMNREVAAMVDAHAAAGVPA